MTAKASAAIAAAIVIAAMLLPPVATAQESTRGSRSQHPLVLASLAVHGSNGYLIGVTLTDRSRMKISVSPAEEVESFDIFNLLSTEYKLDAPQPRGSDRIKASLGKFGRIDLRFIPEEEIEQPAAPLGCKGDKETVQVGSFVGRLAFRGEHGYTTARAKRVFGTVTTAPSLTNTCPKNAGHKPHRRSPHQRTRAALVAMARQAAKPGAHELGLGASAIEGNRKVGFAALRLSASRKGEEVAIDTFIATASIDRGRIQEVGTAANLLVRGPYFKVPDLTHMTSEAVLAPPKPFFGSATLRRESADQVSWKGDLRVDLPGLGTVPLTGSAFKAVMCLDSGCKGEE